MSGLKGLAAFAVIVSVSIMGSAPARSAECLGIQFPDSAKVGSTDLVLNGIGVRKATMFKVDVYVAGLYLPEKGTDGDQIAAANEPWRLELHFVHDADASDIREAFNDGFEKAADDNFDALKSRIDALNAQIVDLKEGDILAYSYDPAIGTIVDMNSEAGPAIEGADFAATLLSLSIGPYPPNEELKTGLLGGPCE
ncbi:MAG: chalcone isomerase family protein [Dongiaceae bacterium]